MFSKAKLCTTVLSSKSWSLFFNMKNGDNLTLKPKFWGNQDNESATEMLELTTYIKEPSGPQTDAVSPLVFQNPLTASSLCSTVSFTCCPSPHSILKRRSQRGHESKALTLLATGFYIYRDQEADCCLRTGLCEYSGVWLILRCKRFFSVFFKNMWID